MNYLERDVLEIIKSLSDKDANEFLEKWNESKANIPLDLEKNKYNQYVCSFPLIIDNEEVATITLVDLRHIRGSAQMLMTKYLGYKAYKYSYQSFSHQSYLDCFLTLHKEFSLPEHSEINGFFTLSGEHSNEFGVIKYRLSAIGNIDDELVEGFLFRKYFNDCGDYVTYRLDNGMSLQIDHYNMKGNTLGESINQIIEKRKTK